MTAVERVRLNREDFIDWLGKALLGAAALPRTSSAGSAKSTDVTLAAPSHEIEAWPIICIAQAQMHDLFAFLSTYAKVRPFSAFFRVLPVELISVLERRAAASKNDLALAKCVAGAAMAEAWIASARESDRPKNVFPVLLASLSSALGQAVLARYDQAAIDWISAEWTELRKQPGDPFGAQDLQGPNVAWRIVSSAVGTPAGDVGADASVIGRFLSNVLAAGAIRSHMLAQLAPLSVGVDFGTLLAASREERINRFNEVVLDLKRRSDRGLRSEFVGGLMLAIAGNGSFDQLRSAREFDGWLDGATTWFGICAALFEESNVLSYGNSAGRRMVRDLLTREDPFRPPHADMNSSEYRFLDFNDALQSSTHAPNAIDVELLPNVMSRVSGASSPDGDHQRDDVEMLLRNLDEAGYMIDRARHMAMGFAGGERQGSLYKPSGRRRSR
ncbi:hypothetical protein FSB78_08440 [Sphingomonas ginsenosidivorax]|uniref:Uncharacterized protein n=1 Tax=Sphingomonas ginsenosidivorax TaxID=862135 RepID=A0A5C6UFF8_9SPHN|nr:hypothetical protein [Sphingomonas ginsenosidivorax]TXC70971.1 hypothetical protein FSB78_08440 [Sphingomonas ginsenosidivorax]